MSNTTEQVNESQFVLIRAEYIWVEGKENSIVRSKSRFLRVNNKDFKLPSWYEGDKILMPKISFRNPLGYGENDIISLCEAVNVTVKKELIRTPDNFRKLVVDELEYLKKHELSVAIEETLDITFIGNFDQKFNKLKEELVRCAFLSNISIESVGYNNNKLTYRIDISNPVMVADSVVIIRYLLHQIMLKHELSGVINNTNGTVNVEFCDKRMSDVNNSVEAMRLINSRLQLLLESFGQKHRLPLTTILAGTGGIVDTSFKPLSDPYLMCLTVISYHKKLNEKEDEINRESEKLKTIIENEVERV